MPDTIFIDQVRQVMESVPVINPNWYILAFGLLILLLGLMFAEESSQVSSPREKKSKGPV